MGVAGNTLGRRFEDAVYYARQQRRAHIEFTATFTSDQISQWTEMIQDWNNDASQPDPFQEPDQGSYLFCLRRPPRHADLAPVITTAQVRRELAQEEENELALGITPLHEVSLSQFLLNGLELEDAQ